MQDKNDEKVEGGETPKETAEMPGADKLIRNHVYAAMAVGLIPLPFLDFAGVTGVQLNLMRKLAQIYNIPFSKDMVKNLIGALIGGAFPASAGVQVGGSIAKIIPGIGHIAGTASVVIVAGAATYAIGKVFNRHFSEGGTFLSFDPEEARAYYEEMFREGQEVAAEIKAGKKKGDSAK